MTNPEKEGGQNLPLQAGALTLLYGQGGSGKSILAADAAARAAVAGMPVMMLCFEGEDATLRRLQGRMRGKPDGARQAVNDNLALYLDNKTWGPDSDLQKELAAPGTTTARLGRLLAMPDGRLPALLIVDSFVTAFAGSVPDGPGLHNAVGRCLTRLKRVAVSMDCAVVLLLTDLQWTGHAPLALRPFASMPENILHVTGCPSHDWTLVQEKRRGSDGNVAAWDLLLDPDLPPGEWQQYVVSRRSLDLDAARRRQESEPEPPAL